MHALNLLLLMGFQPPNFTQSALAAILYMFMTQTTPTH